MDFPDSVRDGFAGERVEAAVSDLGNSGADSRPDCVSGTGGAADSDSCATVTGGGWGLDMTGIGWDAVPVLLCGSGIDFGSSMSGAFRADGSVICSFTVCRLSVSSSAVFSGSPDPFDSSQPVYNR